MDKENIMLKEFTRNIGGMYKEDMVAIYNHRKVSEEEVTTIIQEKVDDANVIVITKQQFHNVFGE